MQLNVDRHRRRAVASYLSGRPQGTQRVIDACKGDRDKLLDLLAERQKLAADYSADGAHHTCACIEEVDIPMIMRAAGDTADTASALTGTL